MLLAGLGGRLQRWPAEVELQRHVGGEDDWTWRLEEEKVIKDASGLFKRVELVPFPE